MSIGVVVITSAQHADGPRFDPWIEHIFIIPPPSPQNILSSINPLIHPSLSLQLYLCYSFFPFQQICQQQLQLTLLNRNSYERMSNNLNYLDGLLKQLLKSKHSNYSEECITFYLDEDRFIVQDLHHIKNKWDERIKCTLIRHRAKGIKGNDATLNSKCIVYLHGLGSSRLQSLNIVQYLPHNYCLCMFDMSGSGKSQGQFLTYGMKESQDIEPVINYLHKKKYIREFVLWGRSMGAVATLLYAIDKHQIIGNHQSRGILTANNSLRNSVVSTNMSEEDSLIKAVILDSPFHNFRDIAKQIATNRLSVPNFIVEVALNYVQSSFKRILQGKIGEKYSPFHINFKNQISLNIPIIFLYSQKDEIVPAYHSERIIKNIKTKFQKLLINECNHNQSRPAKIINEIFQKLQKFNRTKYYESKKMSQSISKDANVSYSCEKRRGIFVYTPSREKQYKTIQYQQNHQIPIKMHQTIDVQNIKFDHAAKSPNKQNYQLRRSRFSLQNSNVTIRNHRDSANQDKHISNIATLDSQTNNLINKKLNGIKDCDSAATRKLRSKRFNFDRRKEVKLTHHKYLQ